MKAEEIREGDIVEIDYIEEFTKEHINEGKALVIWKGFNYQPLVRKLDTKNTIWTCYEHISKVVGHIDIEDYMDKALEQEPTTKNDLGVDCVSRQAVIDELKRYFHDEYYQRTSIQDCRDCFIEDVLNHLPTVTPQEPRWIPVSKKLPKLVEWYLTSIKWVDGTERVTISWFDGTSFKAEVKAWMPLPKPYKAESEDI